jgi:hypothetical protein
METVPKSPERLQAQIEIFADSGVEMFSEAQKLLLRHSRRLSELLDVSEAAVAELPGELADAVENHWGAYA